MSSYFRLQDLTTVDDTGGNIVDQRIEEAIDISGYKTLTVQVRKPVASTAGTTAKLYLEHAAVLDEDAFEQASTTITFDLKTAGNETKVFSDLLRYVRWSAVFVGSVGVDPQFLVDIIAREN